MSGGTLADGCRDHLGPQLRTMGFSSRRGPRWRREDLEIRVVFDSKSGDPYRGGAFTLELERSTDGRFEVKLAGRVRVDQLLDPDQRSQFLRLRNFIAEELPKPDARFLSEMPESLRKQYLSAFSSAPRLELQPWMRFIDSGDVRRWCVLLSGMMPTLVARASTIDPHSLLLGQRLEWQQ